MQWFHLGLLTALAAAPLDGQSLRIYSEFQRIDPFGQIVPVDRSEAPREILSPEMARNSHLAFHVAVTTPPNTSYFLYVGSNPPNLIETRLYKEEFLRTGDQWIPDMLTPLRIPYFGSIPDYAAEIAGQTTRCYLLDIWVPPNVPERRMRVEVLMKIGVWYIAPMELRIVEARVPARPEPAWEFNPELPPVEARADSTALECLVDYLAGQPQTWKGGLNNIRDVIRRDAEQDMAMARMYQKIPEAIRLLADEGLGQWWMKNPAFQWSGSEWYLRVRDWIYRNPASASGR